MLTAIALLPEMAAAVVIHRPNVVCTSDANCSGVESKCCTKQSVGGHSLGGQCYNPSGFVCCADEDPNSELWHVCGGGTFCCRALDSRCCNTGEKCETNPGGGTSCSSASNFLGKSDFNVSINID